MRAIQVIPLLLLLGSAACSGVQTAEDPNKPPPPKTTVVVENQKTVDFNLYVRWLAHASEGVEQGQAGMASAPMSCGCSLHLNTLSG